MASIFKDSVAQAIANQPGYIRRKDSLTALAGTVLQVGNLLVAFTADAPAWLNSIIPTVIGIAQIVIHAGTKGAITPSMITRLEQVGSEAHLDRPSVSHPPAAYIGQHRATGTEDGLPVYDGPTSVGQ